MIDQDEEGGGKSRPAAHGSAASGPSASGEVAPRATRRSFTREYKRRIVREADEAAKPGGSGVGALLRREGLYSASLVAWRRELKAGELDAGVEKKRGPKPRFTPQEKDNQRLERENERLRKRLAQAEALLDLQKKFQTMMRDLQPSEESLK
jgi:transposase-like protein